MTNIFKLKYAFIDDLSNIYDMNLFSDITVTNFLEIINLKQEKKYISLFYEQNIIKLDDLIYDYWEKDHQYIFIASINLNPPSIDFQEKLKTIKETSFSEYESRNNVTMKFKFFSTGVDKEMLFEGIDVELNIGINPDECSKQLFKYIENKIDLDNKKMIIYLAGGIPFISGTLGDLYLNEFLKLKKVIYGVIFNYDISDDYLNVHILSCINLSDTNHRKLISPFYESTNQGLCDMACLFEFFHIENELLRTDLDHFISSIAHIINFPSLIISLHKIRYDGRINDNNNDIARDIVTIFSTLFTFF